MMQGLFRPFCAIALAVALMSGIASIPALAHRVNIFAWVEGDIVHVQAEFSRKTPARQSAVTVYKGGTSEATDVLLTGATDDTGVFSFAVPAEAREHGLTVRVNAGQGHQNDWTMDAKEFAVATNGEQTSQDSQAVNATPAAPVTAPSQSGPAVGTEQARKTRQAGSDNGRAQPKQHAQAYMADDGPRLRDILGGLGWIVGLTGMGMAWRARRRHG